MNTDIFLGGVVITLFLVGTFLWLLRAEKKAREP